MMFSRTLALATLALGLLANFGCTSSPASSGATTTVTTTTQNTNCTTSTNGDSEICIPTLGNYGNVVEYFGQINVSNASLLVNLIQNIPGMPAPSSSLVKNYTYLDIFLNATASPPVIMTVLVGQDPNYQYELQGQVGFTASTSNPSAGTFELNVAGLSIVDPIQINSLTQPWDGSLQDLTALSVTIGSGFNPTFGTVGLIRIQ